MQRTKKSEHTQSENKFLKSKYLDSKKSNLPLNLNKVMLNDLCPQEKAKIGQLIKTLQQRKKQNQDLQQQLNSWKSNYVTLDKVKNELQNLIEIKNFEVKKLSSQLNKINQQKIEKDIELHEVHLELQKYIKKASFENLTQSYGINTSTILTLTQQTQTKEKKKKLKDREVQVNTIERIAGFEQRQTRKNNFYQPNSKSFDKIMKGETLLSSQNKHYETAAFREEQHFDQAEISLGGRNKNIPKPPKIISSNIEQFYGNKQLRASELEQNQKNWQQYEEQNHVPNQKSNQQQIQIEDTQNDDDEFQILAKKWLQLKEKNIQHLTQGYLINNEMQDPALNMNLKSLGIQSKLRNPGQNPHFQHNEEQEEQVDQEELNRALKSKDFSASRLLNNSRSKRNVSEQSEKKSLENSESSYRNARVKGQVKPINTMNRVQNEQKKGGLGIKEERNIIQSKYSQDHSSRGVDFYSAELLELVEEINK